MKVPEGYSQLNTTVPQDLMRTVKAQAVFEGVTLQALVIRGLRKVVQEPPPLPQKKEP